MIRFLFPRLAMVAAVVGAVLSIVAAVYISFFLQTGFQDFSAPWLYAVLVVVSMGLIVNSILLYKARQSLFSSYYLFFISVVLSIIILYPLYSVIFY